MKFYNLLFLMSARLVLVSANLARNCRNVSDCECGQQCVDVMDLRLCHSDTCACLKGCVVGKIFIPPGVTRPNTYCNWCSCGVGEHDGIPVCTRRRWCDLNEDGPIYQENPKCDERPDEQTQEIIFQNF